MIRKKRGILLFEAIVAILIAGVVAMIFTSINYYSSIQASMLKFQTTKQTLEVVRSRLLDSAADIDTDGYFELVASDSDHLPISVSLTTDAWGRPFVYYAQDLGVANTDPDYTQTTTAISPNQNIVARVISTGEDGTLDTTTTDAEALGDDLIIEIGLGELNHYKLYGGSEISTQTRAYNSAIISTTEPTTPTNGLIWLDTSANPAKLKVYDGTEWKKVNLN